MKVEIEDGRLIVTPITEEDSRMHLCIGGRLCRIRCCLLSDHGRSSSLHR